MSGLRVLHLTRHKSAVPETLHSAAAAVQMLPMGLSPDRATQEFAPQVITICAPFDTDARAAIEAVQELGLPAVGIGSGSAPFLTTTVSSGIGAADLAAVMELSTALQACRFPLGAASREEADLARYSEQVIQMLEQIQAMRIPGYQERAQSIFDTCLWIGNHLCLIPSDLKDLLWAARLREIGKIALPDRILNTARPLRTDEEQRIHDSYPGPGVKALRSLAQFRGAANLIQYHLENFDGSGPDHLTAQQIPLGSRILRVAAAFYMIMHDSHGQARTSEVMEMLDHGRGSLYDPLLVKLVGNYHALALSPDVDRHSRQVRIAELVPGMVLAEDVWSRTGMKIIAKGTRLSPHTLRILLQYPLDPSMESVEVAQ